MPANIGMAQMLCSRPSRVGAVPVAPVASAAIPASWLGREVAHWIGHENAGADQADADPGHERRNGSGADASPRAPADAQGCEGVQNTDEDKIGAPCPSPDDQ